MVVVYRGRCVVGSCVVEGDWCVVVVYRGRCVWSESCVVEGVGVWWSCVRGRCVVRI